MYDFKRIEKLDSTILDRISEAEVEMWIAAKLQSMREKLPARNLTLGSNYREYRDEKYYDVNWGMHAADKCSGTSPSTAACLKTLTETLLDNPKKRAAYARWKAKELLKKAEQLEALSVAV